MAAPDLKTNEEYVGLKTVSERYGIKRSTMYDWKYRPDKYDIPDGMLKKFGRSVKVNLIIFENWFHHRNG